MIAMDGENGQWQLGQPLLFEAIPETTIEIHPSIAKDDHRVVTRRGKARAEPFNPAEFPVGISCDIKQNISPLASGTGSRMTILLNKKRIPATSGDRKWGYFHHKIL